MPSQVLTTRDMNEILATFVSEFDTQKEAATALKIGQSFLSDMLSGKRVISNQVAERLGYRRVYGYQSAHQSDANT